MTTSPNQVELIEGTTRDHSLSQFFTPPKLAAKLVEWADVKPFLPGPRIMRVLEPSAGNGAIVRELAAAGAHVEAVEIDPRYYGDLTALKIPCVWGEDFLKMELELWIRDQFDLVCGNFPFHLDLDGAFTLHALKFAPRVCAIYPANVFYSGRRGAKLWKHVRPTRAAFMSERAWEGATDYVALELVKRRTALDALEPVAVEWWTESWG